MVDLEKLRLLYFQNEEPVPYSLKCGYQLNIVPMKVKDWGYFEYSVPVLTIRKNEIEDPNIMRMNYLQFLHEVVIPSDEIYYAMFCNILSKSLLESKFYLSKDKGRSVVVLGDDFGSVKAIITPKEFDEISKIILYQNMVDYDDRYVSPEIREAMEEYQKMKSKGSNTVSPILEKKKAYVIGKTGMSMVEINDMTYRTFSQVFDSLLESEMFIANKIIQASTKYDTGKENITHPVLTKRIDPYEEMFVDKQAFKGKLGETGHVKEN